MFSLSPSWEGLSESFYTLKPHILTHNLHFSNRVQLITTVNSAADSMAAVTLLLSPNGMANFVQLGGVPCYATMYAAGSAGSTRASCSSQVRCGRGSAMTLRVLVVTLGGAEGGGEADLPPPRVPCKRYFGPPRKAWNKLRMGTGGFR